MLLKKTVWSYEQNYICIYLSGCNHHMFCMLCQKEKQFLLKPRGYTDGTLPLSFLTSSSHSLTYCLWTQNSCRDISGIAWNSFICLDPLLSGPLLTLVPSIKSSLYVSSTTFHTSHLTDKEYSLSTYYLNKSSKFKGIFKLLTWCFSKASAESV